MIKLGKYLATGMIVLGSVIANASQAKAVVYEFFNYNPGSGGVFANGFFDLSTNPGATINWATDVMAFEINLRGPGGDVVLDDPAQIEVDSLSTASVASDGLTFDFGIVGSGGFSEELRIIGSGGEWFIVLSNGFETIGGGVLGANSSQISPSGLPFSGGFLATAAPTAVPFEVSPTLGILAIGGIWGVSRLRKKIAARKLDIKENG